MGYYDRGVFFLSMYKIKRVYISEDGNEKVYEYSSEDFGFSITYRTNHRWTEEEKEKFRKMYADPATTTRQIAQHFRISMRAVYGVGARLNLHKALPPKLGTDNLSKRRSERHRDRMLNDPEYVKRIRERGRERYYKTHPDAKRRKIEEL